MTNLKTAKSIDTAPTGELANYHQQIIDTYKNSKPGEIKMTADSQALMAFNGYYALGNAPGAFFAVDTNVLVIDAQPAPLYFLDLLISLDGKNPKRFRFTGTFSNNKLVQDDAELNINLAFVRADSSNSITASCSGTITLPGQASTDVTGTTYNNPIPSILFSGNYYVPENSAANAITAQPAMIIKEDYQILFDNFANNGVLEQVPFYVYNMNMYFFTAIASNHECVFLIMGSAAEGGLVCNNMCLNGTSRSVQTIAAPVMAKLNKANANSAELAQYSGYYQLSAIAPGAFLSIQGEYTVTNATAVPAYKVKIAVSIDGTTASGWYFEDATMTFLNNTLTINDQSISITFTREYNNLLNSLVTITGNIMQHNNVAGYTLFNPVPLSAFGGATMTDSKGNSLTVVSDSEVIYVNGTTKVSTTMDNIVYVPIMYILANPSVNSTTEMSFGTNGLNGNTCIVTDSGGVNIVSAIS